MQSLVRGIYTAIQVDTALHASNRTMKFRYDLLSSTNAYKAPLTTVISASVANNNLAQIKRTARFKIRDDGAINYLSDRIKPYAQLLMNDGGYAEFPLGVFLLSTPPRTAEPSGKIRREVDAYDQLQVLMDDVVDVRYTVTAGTNYIVAIKALLDSAGITLQNLTATISVLPAARDWDPGTTKLKIINDLMGAINYRSLFFDEDGIATAMPYQSPAARASEYTYIDDSLSVTYPEVEQALTCLECRISGRLLSLNRTEPF
jgi:hypothetical protein